MPAEITIAELVRNKTMSAEMAAVLWAAVDEQVSFLTVALPRFAGKSTTSNAVLSLRRPDIALHPVAGEPEVMEPLKRERLGGYLVVGEFSRAPVPGYIWGEPVRRVFETLEAGYSLHSALHASSVEEAVRVVAEGNEVGDELTSHVKLIIYIERFGNDESDFWRRVSTIYELHGVKDAAPIGHPLFVWHSDTDRFEKVSDPHQFGRDRADIERRTAIIAELAESEKTSAEDVGAATSKYRAAKA